LLGPAAKGSTRRLQFKSPMKARSAAAIPRKQDTGHDPVHRNGARPIQGLLEGLMTTGGRQVLAACSMFCHLQLAARHGTTEPPHREVTSPAVCAPSGGPRCPPQPWHCLVGWACRPGNV